MVEDGRRRASTPLEPGARAGHGRAPIGGAGLVRGIDVQPHLEVDAVGVVGARRLVDGGLAAGQARDPDPARQRQVRGAVDRQSLLVGAGRDTQHHHRRVQPDLARLSVQARRIDQRGVGEAVVAAVGVQRGPPRDVEQALHRLGRIHAEIGVAIAESRHRPVQTEANAQPAGVLAPGRPPKIATAPRRTPLSPVVCRRRHDDGRPTRRRPRQVVVASRRPAAARPSAAPASWLAQAARTHTGLGAEWSVAPWPGPRRQSLGRAHRGRRRPRPSAPGVAHPGPAPATGSRPRGRWGQRRAAGKTRPSTTARQRPHLWCRGVLPCPQAQVWALHRPTWARQRTSALRRASGSLAVREVRPPPRQRVEGRSQPLLRRRPELAAALRRPPSSARPRQPRPSAPSAP